MMRKRRSTSKNTIILLIVLLLIGIGIAYAALTEQLTINTTVSYNAMKWDVGFSSTKDNGGTITSTSSITNEGKSITVNCDFGKSTTQQSCIVKATITNNGTFDIGLSSDPIIVYDDTYIHTLTFKWENHPTYLNSTVLERGFIEKGTSQNVILTVKTKNLTKDMLPADGVTIPITITLDFEEWQEETLPTTEDLAILMESGCYYEIEEMICSDGSLGEILSHIGPTVKTITIENKIDLSDAMDALDISESHNGSVMLVAKMNEEYSSDEQLYYDLYIQSDTQLYANNNMSAWFSYYTNLAEINGLELLDTSMTTNMSYMFSNFGFYDENSTYSLTNLDVSNFDTSNVTDMSAMFVGAGALGETFSLDMSKFDTSKVTNMMGMFAMYGATNTTVELDLKDFDTSNVTNMSAMFVGTGAESTTLNIDLRNFSTSNVINMSSMFEATGIEAQTVTIDISNFDTSNVTDMSYMFNDTGGSSKLFTIELSKLNTSNVIQMQYMLDGMGLNSTNLVTSITIKNPNVVSYSGVFYQVAMQPGSQITVNYTSETSDLVDKMIATKSEGSNVVKGIQVD